MREYALRLGMDLASTLSKAETEVLAQAGTERWVPPGTILQRQDDPANYLNYLRSGMVKTCQVHASGYETVLRIHLAGSLIGVSSLNSRGHLDATSVTLKASRLITLSKPRFLRLLEKHPGLCIKLVGLLADRLSDLHFRIGELQGQPVEQRLAYALISLSRAAPDDKNKSRRTGISLTHEELAQLINTRRQTVTSTLRRFAELGYVSRSLRCIEVVSPKGLRRLFDQNLDKCTGH